MENLVQLLLDRVQDDPNKCMRMIMIMDNAINEMHNNHVIASLPPQLAAKVHDPDPQVRVTEKTLLAKAAGKSYIPVYHPTLLETKELGYTAVIDYDPRYVNSIALCLQDELEKLFQSGLYKKNPSKSMEYRITLKSEYDNIQPFVDHMHTLNDLYETFNIIVYYNGNQLTGKSTEDNKKKKGFFGGLFKKK